MELPKIHWCEPAKVWDLTFTRDELARTKVPLPHPKKTTLVDFGTMLDQLQQRFQLDAVTRPRTKAEYLSGQVYDLFIDTAKLLIKLGTQIQRLQTFVKLRFTSIELDFTMEQNHSITQHFDGPSLADDPLAQVMVLELEKFLDMMIQVLHYSHNCTAFAIHRFWLEMLDLENAIKKNQQGSEPMAPPNPIPHHKTSILSSQELARKWKESPMAQDLVKRFKDRQAQLRKQRK